jgi:nucleotide-binding universal stress UspA family protein
MALRCRHFSLTFMSGTEQVMYETVIVPLDGTRPAESALPAALSLARQADAMLRLISVLEVPDTLAAWSRRGRSEDWLTAPRSDAQSYLDGVATHIGYARTETRVEVGDPARSILAECERLGQSVLVMARRSRSALKERFARGVTLRVARQSNCPMIIVPAGNEPDTASDFRLDSVLVPLDGSRFAERVLPALAGDVLNPARLHIHLLSVVELAAWHSSRRAVMYAYDLDRYIADMRRIASRYLERAHQALAPKVAGVDCDVRVGRVPEQICLAADEEDVDLIVMSTHGRSGMERFLLGSVAEAVVTAAHRPVLLIRATA